MPPSLSTSRCPHVLLHLRWPPNHTSEVVPQVLLLLRSSLLPKFPTFQVLTLSFLSHYPSNVYLHRGWSDYRGLILSENVSRECPHVLTSETPNSLSLSLKYMSLIIINCGEVFHTVADDNIWTCYTEITVNVQYI